MLREEIGFNDVKEVDRMSIIDFVQSATASV
jgi:hypothetical protein